MLSRTKIASFAASAAVLFAAAGLATPALAQPNKRQTPPIRTPATPAKPGTPPAGTPTPPADPSGKPPVDPNDPLSKVNQGPKEIEFKPKGPGDLVSFNLDDADLPDLVKAIGQVTGKRFIYGAKVKTLKATVYSPDKVTAAEAYNAFLAILAANGLTVIPHGQFLEITESTLAVTQNTPMYGAASPTPNEDRYITRLYRLQSVDAGEVKTVLDKFKSKDGDITVYAPGNLLIMTETGENLRRLLRLIEEIDVGAAGDQIWVQPVLNGSATETATKLNEILNLKAGAGGKTSNIVADERTNSLIITATKGDYDRMLELLKRIDVPTTGDGQLHVLPLQHALCTDLSQTLNGILGGGGGVSRSTGTGAAGRGQARPATAPAAGGGAATGTNEDIFEGQVKITCDEATNSLVTTSSQHDYAQLRTVIDKLDQPRRQVFIEAVIMDLDVNHSTDWGIGYHGGAPLGSDAANPSFIYGGNNPVPSAITGAPSNLEALALGVRGPELDGSENLLGTGVSIPALGVVLHAVAKDGDSNVLATPHVLATDSVKATISIGQDIPYQTNLGNIGSIASALGGGQATGALAGLGSVLGGGLGLGGQGGRTEVGTKLEVTPHINDSDQVRLEIVETISDLGSRDGALGAATINKREASTTLIVRDQQTVVIGGLMREAEGVSETKVPVLGDIPILGFLFKQQKKTRQKSNLLLILTPYVIRDQDDLRAIFERKMQERQEFLDRYFVFNDEDWEPPEDYDRKNGLVESIRQSQLEADDKQRIIEDARPRTPKTHDPVEPVPLPSIATQKAGATGDGTQPAQPTPTNPAATPIPGRGKIRTPGQPAPPKVE
ncbi:MAG: type II secretion system secretin GspD [Polyangiaceae bacterium]